MYQPFEDLLDYSEFSLKLRVKDMPDLLGLLESIPQEELERYRQNL